MPRIRCPKCGNETAKILWGMPAGSEKLQKDIEAKKIYLGGCEMMVPPPSRHCFTCDEDVCYTFYPVDEAETRTIEFEIGGFFQGFKKIVVERDKESYWASYYAPFSMDEPEKRLHLQRRSISSMFIKFI